MPSELEELKRKMTGIEIELAALKKDGGDGAKLKKEERGKELGDLKEKAENLEKRWREQKEIIQNIQELRAKRDALSIELEQAERSVDLQKAAEIKYGKLPEIEKKLEELHARWNTIPEEARVLREEVDEDDIGRVVSRWTGIPVTRLLTTESERLSHLEEELGKRVVGQKEAVSVLSRAIRRARTGLSPKNKPIGSFLFLGPTGVGKTETAKALCSILFSDEHALTRIDMSEYQESHSVARLIGAPPGYIGYDEGGQLTEAVRRKPYSVLLIDEIEKAHSQVFNLFLQIFDEGRLTDSRGVTVDFKNTIIILTSNLGSEVISSDIADAQKEKKVWETLHQAFKPEFLNRLDSVVLFHALTLSEVREIAMLQLEHVAKRLLENNINLKISKDLIEYVAKKGYDPVFGARPLKRVIESELVDEIAMQILEEKIKPEDIISTKVEKENLIVGVEDKTQKEVN